jgi:PAS domain-containing protein
METKSIDTKVELFVRNNYSTVSSYTGVHIIKELLAEQEALVVVDEEDEGPPAGPLGVLTLEDIARKPHNLVVDCLSVKDSLQVSCTLDEALLSMHRQHTGVLPVYRGEVFTGLVFRNDLVRFISSENSQMGSTIALKTEELQQTHRSLNESARILKAIYDSSDSFKLLVAPDYSMLFFNKNVYEYSFQNHPEVLKKGDCLLEFTNKTLRGALPRLKYNFQKALKGENIVAEHRVRTDKGIHYFRVNYDPVYEGTHLIGVAITLEDITDRKKNEYLVKQQNLVLREIMFTQSHEIRGPVASILGLLRLFDHSEFTGQNRELMEMLERSVLKLDSEIRRVVHKAYKWDTENVDMLYEDNPFSVVLKKPDPSTP